MTPTRVSTPNRTSRLVFAAALLVVVSLLACGLRQPKVPGRRAQMGTLVHGGVLRSHVLYIPDSIKEKHDVPLIVALHGRLGTGHGFESMTYGHFNERAEEIGAVIVYPDGIDEHWNDGRSDDPALRQDIDDVGYLVMLVDLIATHYPIDRTKVFVTGASNGGLMAFRLACERPDIFRAVAPVMSAFGAEIAHKCNPLRPVSLLMINGTQDPLIPYEGQYVVWGKKTLGKRLSTQSAIDRWRGLMKCPREPINESFDDRVPNDGTTVSRSYSTGCWGGSEVVLYRVEGGGHTWPQGHQYLPQSWVGKVSQEINATDIVFDFFMRTAQLSPARTP